MDFKFVRGLVLIKIYNEEKILNFLASNYMNILSYGLLLKVKVENFQKSIAYWKYGDLSWDFAHMPYSMTSKCVNIPMG